MRVRKPSNKGGVKKVISKFPSYRMNRVLYAEGNIELDYLYHLEFDHPAVTHFREQPGRIHYELDGRWRHYTPDFYVERLGERLIVEVKREDEAQEDGWQRLFNIAKSACERDGCKFVVETDKTIRVQPRLDNIKLLARYERTDIDNPLYQIACHEFFATRGEASLTELMQYFASRGARREVVYALLFWKVLATDLMTPVCADSVVSMPGVALSERRAS